MSVPSDVMTVIREWVVKAENDLKNAVHTLAMKNEAPTDTICFHAQHKAKTESIRRYGLSGCRRVAHNRASVAVEVG
jgi:hypothetical protein